MSGTGIIGGTFNPPHVGHLIIAESASAVFGLDKVIFIPSNIPPHAKSEQPIDARHRLAMTKLATQDNPRFEVSDIELCRQGPSFTLDTVRALKDFGLSDLCMIIGSDMLEILPKWHRIDELLEEIRFIIARRPDVATVDEDLIAGFSFPEQNRQMLREGLFEGFPIDVSSSHVRSWLRSGRSVRHLVPDTVLEYIRAEKLYR